ncbi:MAG: hypothetical protein WAS05_01650 [Candidatus Nanopelagicales bacterium]
MMIAAAEISEQAQVSNWPMRILLTVLTIAVIAGFFTLIIRSWRRRAARQDQLGSLPDVPQEVTDAVESGELDLVEMRYIGTASDVNWNDKIAYAGLSNRGFAEVGVHGQGVVIDRGVGGVLFIPRDSIVSVRLDKGVAGRAYGKDGVVALRWVHSDQALDTGLRSSSADIRDALQSQVENMAQGGARFTPLAGANTANANTSATTASRDEE